VSAANSHHDTAGERPHLSIGEVLGLLQEDYPDITISKIRFLESQGLLDPERTPSGYRKFHDEDVEQLRWVLRQQKENFLPLKVIKDRLAAGRLDEPASASGLLDLAVEPRADTDTDTDTSVPAPDASRNGSHPPVAEAATVWATDAVPVAWADSEWAVGPTPPGSVRSRTRTEVPSTFTSWARVGRTAGIVSAAPVRMSNFAP
jgi:DNA-binding transcriptional MerR regulator